MATNYYFPLLYWMRELISIERPERKNWVRIFLVTRHRPQLEDNSNGMWKTGWVTGCLAGSLNDWQTNCIGCCLLSFEVPKYQNSDSTLLGSCSVVVVVMFVFCRHKNGFQDISTWHRKWPSIATIWTKYFRFIGFVCVFVFMACLLFHFGMLPHNNNAHEKSWCFEIYSKQTKSISQFARSKQKSVKKIETKSENDFGYVIQSRYMDWHRSQPKRYSIPRAAELSCTMLCKNLSIKEYHADRFLFWLRNRINMCHGSVLETWRD